MGRVHSTLKKIYKIKNYYFITNITSQPIHKNGYNMHVKQKQTPLECVIKTQTVKMFVFKTKKKKKQEYKKRNPALTKKI